MIKQKIPLMLYDNGVNQLHADQWTLLKRLLPSIEKVTKTVRLSAESYAAGDVISLVINIKSAIERMTNDAGIQKIKKELTMIRQHQQ